MSRPRRIADAEMALDARGWDYDDIGFQIQQLFKEIDRLKKEAEIYRKALKKLANWNESPHVNKFAKQALADAEKL